MPKTILVGCTLCQHQRYSRCIYFRVPLRTIMTKQVVVVVDMPIVYDNPPIRGDRVIIYVLFFRAFCCRPSMEQCPRTTRDFVPILVSHTMDQVFGWPGLLPNHYLRIGIHVSHASSRFTSVLRRYHQAFQCLDTWTVFAVTVKPGYRADMFHLPFIYDTSFPLIQPGSQLLWLVP